MNTNTHWPLSAFCLICAVCGFLINHLTSGFLWGGASFLILVCGVIAGFSLLVKGIPGKRPKSLRILCSLSVLATVLVSSAFTLSTMRESARRHNCAHNLKSMGVALLMYSGDYSGHFPPEYEVLNTTEYLLASKVYWCPSSGEAPDDISPTSANYLYFGSGQRDDTPDSGQTVIACDKPGNHDGRWLNCLFIDGHVEGVEARSYEEVVQKTDWIIPGIKAKKQAIGLSTEE